MPAGTFSFRMNVPVKLEGGVQSVNIPIDAVIKPKKAKAKDLPLFFEAKSAGDFTNTNKRRKEEAVKMTQLRATYGDAVRFNLFLCGYFDTGYLGYEAAEGIDWVWEHRIDDLMLFGI
jgi:type II restriction enzyme